MNEAELLARILAAPEEDAPRRAYAELLVKRGDPRGEFILIQLRIAEIYRARGPREELASLTPRQRRLLHLYGDEWSAEAYPCRANECTFYRGFVEVANLHPGTFAWSGDELCARSPILHLELDCGEVDGLASLCRSPKAERILSISLYGNPVGDEGAALIAKSAFLPRLSWLDLRNTGLTRAGIEALAASKHLQRLRWLEVGVDDVPNPVDQPDTTEGDAISFWSPTLFGQELEARYGPKAWMHYRVDDRFWYPPSRQGLAGPESSRC